MFSPQGPSLRELCVQALSSVERGYDLLAPKFDHTPFRTPESILDATADALSELGPFGHGTGRVLRYRRGHAGSPVPVPRTDHGRRLQRRHARAGARAPTRTPRGCGPTPGPCPSPRHFDLAVTFGALGHFLPAERPALFEGVYRALRPGGLFAFPIGAPPPVTSVSHWATLGFDLAMRVRNAVWRPPFVMYYRTSPLPAVCADLTAAGFTVTAVALTALGRRPRRQPTVPAHPRA